MTLWINNNGRTACPRHGGGYLTAAVAARPRARRHETPLDTWRKITATDRALWREAGCGAIRCEDCP